MAAKGFFSIFRSSSSDDTAAEKQPEAAKPAEIPANETANEPAAPRANAIARGEVTQEMADFAQEKLTELLSLCNFGGEVNITNTSNGRLCLEILNCEDPGRVIGRDGHTLHAFQTLIRAFIVSRFNQGVQVILDADQYQSKKDDQVRQKARQAAQYVKRYHKAFEMDPMNARDRRIVHELFKNETAIRTASMGEGRDRRVVISPVSAD